MCVYSQKTTNPELSMCTEGRGFGKCSLGTEETRLVQRLRGKHGAEIVRYSRDWARETDGKGDWSSQSLRTAVV